MPDSPAILFTAFEPSGDDHSAAVIAELKRRHPDLRIYAWGGPKMAQAGAEIVEQTGNDAVVGVPGFEKIREHLQINKTIRRWLGEHPEVALHIPVDSPAANFPICKIAKKARRKVLHLVAPQLWAWGPWRIRKLRKCTDMVLCLLPFEEKFFRDRGVDATFVGHPLFDEDLDLDALNHRSATLASGNPKVAVLPGSRPAEIRRNFPVMLNAFRELRKRHPELIGLVGATTEQVREDLYQRANLHGGWPDGLDVLVGETDVVANWADLAMVVSGTVTLQVSKQQVPMVIMYKTNQLMYNCIGRWVLTTKHFALPNLIAGKEVIPELIPYFKDNGQLLEAMDNLIADPVAQQAQRDAQASIVAKFRGPNASESAADAIEKMLGIG
ncbi:MAG: lipid-A-disaccharide synthase [Phycisphaerales bacterium JB050]